MKILKTKKENKLDEAINSVHEQMALLEPNSEEYTKMVKNLEVLYNAKAKSPKFKVDMNMVIQTLLTGGFILIEILAITKHEETDIITSKAFGRVGKWRV